MLEGTLENIRNRKTEQKIIIVKLKQISFTIKNSKQNLRRRARGWDANFRWETEKHQTVHRIANPDTWFYFCPKTGNRERNRTENTNRSRHYLKTEKPKLFGSKTDLKIGRNGKSQCPPLGSVRTEGMFRAWPFRQVRLRVHMGSDAVKSNFFPLLQLILRQFTASFCELVLFPTQGEAPPLFLRNFLRKDDAININVFVSVHM